MRSLVGRKSTIALIVYVASAFVLYFLLVEPSLQGKHDLRVGADAADYITYAQYFGEGEQLITVSGNTLGPVVILRLLNYNNFLVVILNCLLLLSSYALFVRSFNFNRLTFVALLLVNPMMFFSLTSINKEILGVFSVASFACYLEKGNRWLLIPALSFGLLARWPQLLIMFTFMILRARFYPFRRNRRLNLVLLVLAISIIYPLLRSSELLTPFYEGAQPFSEAQVSKAFGLLEYLNTLQDNYAFFLAVIPKVLINYIGNVPRIFDTLLGASYLNYNDIYNTYVVLGHQICMSIVGALFVQKRKFTLKSINVYFLLFYSAVLSISPLINYRVFFPIYPLFCLELSRHRQEPSVISKPNQHSQSRDRFGATAQATMTVGRIIS